MPLAGIGNPNAVKPGDVFAYEVVVDLPELPANQSTSLTISVLSMNPLSNIPPFPICAPSVFSQSIGPHVQLLGGISAQTSYNQNNISRVDMFSYTFNNVTATPQSDINSNKIMLTFGTVLVESSQLQSNNTYSIIAGVTYGDYENFIWIGESKLVANFSSRIFNAQGSVVFVPTSLQKGETSFVTVNITITKPATDISISVFSPYGFDDRFSFGKPNITFGGSFACNDLEFWKYDPVPSFSKTNTGKATFSFPFLINSDPTRNVTNNDNIMTVAFPFTVMPTADSGFQSFVVGFQLDNSDVWSSVINISVLNSAFEPSLTQPLDISWTLLNTDDIPPGSAAVFQLSIIVGPKSSVNFELVTSVLDSVHVVPISASIEDTGLCGLLVGNFSQEFAANSLTTIFGVGTNADPVYPTKVLISVAYRVQPTAADGSQTVSASLGNVAIQNMIFNVTTNHSQESIRAVGTSLGFVNGTLYPKTEIGMNVKVYVPPGVSANEMNFTTLPDEDVTLFDLRICQVIVRSIGEGLPCVQDKSFLPLIGKSESSRKFTDMAQMSIGQICSANISDSEDDNSFSIDVVFELPFQSSIVGGIYLIPSTVLMIDNNSIFAGINGMITTNSSLLKNLELGSNNPSLNQTTPYLGLTDANSDDPVYNGGVHYTRVVLKTQPKTRGNYQLLFSPGDQNYVCMIKVLKIGQNMPCALKPEGYLDQYSKANIVYKQDYSAATLTFDALTNWGNSTMLSNNYIDDDAIEIGVFFRRNPSTADAIPGLFNFTGALSVGSIQRNVTNTLTKSGTSLPAVNTLKLNPVFIAVGDNDTLDQIFIGVPKIIGLQLTVPTTFYGGVTIKFTNLDYVSGQFFDFCGAQATTKGLNVPCTNQSQSFLFSTMFKTLNDRPSFYDSIYLTIELLHFPFTDNSAENNVVVEVTVKVPLTFAGTAINIQASLDTTGESVSTTIPVGTAPDNYGDNPNQDFTVVTNNTQIVSQVGWKQWIPVNITIPRKMTIPLEIGVFTPSQNGRAIFTVEDARFTQVGSNICCTSSALNITQLFTVEKKATSNITTFMQKDYMNINLGYVVNGGYTFRNGLEVPLDNQFSLDILIQVTDHPALSAGSINTVYISAKSNQTTVTGSSSIQMSRSSNRQIYERAFIVLNLTIPNQRLYNKGEKINISAVVYHSNYSRAEGAGNVFVQLMLPAWLGYDNASDSFASNYTSGTCSLLQQGGNANSSLAFAFSNGVYFSDFISVNFSLTVDPLDRLGNGRGIVNSSIISQVHCMSSVFGGFPPTNTTKMICGPYVQFPISVLSPECLNSAPIQDCGVTASTAMDVSHLPGNVLLDDASVWAPAVRTGTGWRDFLMFDFLSLVRLTAVYLTMPVTVYRIPINISVLASMTGLSWTTIINQMVPISGIITLPSPTQTRMTKLVIEEAGGTPGPSPIGIQKVDWKGCFVSSKPVLQTCAPDSTRISSNVSQYRQVAYDSANKILYFCDLNPYRNSGLTCYSNKLGTKTFTELPSYINNILGYSPSQSRAYFKDRSGADLASVNGQRMEILVNGTMAGITDLVMPTVIPGYTSPMTPVTVGPYTANFFGIIYGGKKLVSWAACCVP